MKVLVAEDDPEQLSLRCMLLDQSGFDAIGAADGPSAVDLAVAQKPECAVIDLRLPTEELGLRLISELKRMDPSIHILVLTGSDPQNLVQKPEAELIEEIVVKGTPTGGLIHKLKLLAGRAGSS
ncbi:MAG: response regulator [Acidobacteriaceae bacterium]|nr:response regulator [Acidobacteriaceae bacterium]MBV9778397.1 response regulator [Acidobacteriaceae bacterium]